MKRTRLKPDPEKVREFQKRGQEASARSLRAADGSGKGLARTTGPKPGNGPRMVRPGEGPLTPGAWKLAVFALDGGRCVNCGAGPFNPNDSMWVWSAHHPIPKSLLRRERLLGSVWDPMGGVVLCKRCHERHELAVERVPYERLPERVKVFAAGLGSRFEDVLTRLHPQADGRKK